MDMTHIDLRAAAFARENQLITGGAIDPMGILDMLEERERQGHQVKCPVSFLKAMSHEGTRFTSLAEFPRGVLLRVCHNRQGPAPQWTGRHQFLAGFCVPGRGVLRRRVGWRPV